MNYVKREDDQAEQTIQFWIEALNDGAEATIVTVDGEILDGHHRYEASRRAGIAINSINITKAQYQSLQEAGYDDMEIACAAHLTYGDIDNATAYEFQFPGAGVLDRANEAAELL